MYWFGIRTEKLDFDWDILPSRRLRFVSIPVDDIIDVLDSFGKKWTPAGEFFQEALPVLESTSGFSKEEVRKTLGLLPGLLSRESLEKRLRSEFFPLEMLDRFAKTPYFAGKTRALPLGTLLHVTAGNVFLSSIDSLIMGLVTKNLNILKVSGQNTFFPIFFADKLLQHDVNGVVSDKFAVLHWKGGETQIENLMMSKIDGLIAWGGEEMIESYRSKLPANVKFLGFGPKISIQILSTEGLRNRNLEIVAQKIVEDIVPWDQGACASPQNLYIQEGIDEEALLKAIDRAFQFAPERGQLDADEAVEIQKERYRSFYSELMENGKSLVGDYHLLHLENNRLLRPSSLHRSLIIKRFTDEGDLLKNLGPFSYYLQSCSYLLGDKEKDLYLGVLSLAGIKRFGPLGTITFGMEGAPHDGRNVLRELVNMVGDEIRSVDYGEVQQELTNAVDMKNHFESRPHPRGYIFSSGGTTGTPKFIHFSYEEFDQITDMLAYNLRCQGIGPGTTVANLFVAGNLWSSFMAMERALEKIGAVQLPIGGLCSTDNIVLYLQKFSPDVVMGIPSLLVSNAEVALRMGAELHIPKVFYAGEGLSQARRDFLKSAWKTKYFGSAGYASVDAGMIAYQCDKCGPGEHHLFTDLVDMKIVEGEAIVTSHYRKSLPIINYRTGDRVEWMDDKTCGKSDKKFRLLGRIDNIIQIWSCRIRLEDIEMALPKDIKTWQISLIAIGAREILQLHLESQDLDQVLLLDQIYENSRDLKDTLTKEEFTSLVEIKLSDVPRNERTGKVSLIKDLRD
jgi:phenylacetate-CoA ligase